MANRALSRVTLIALALIPINSIIWWKAINTGASSQNGLVGLFAIVALAQLVCGVWAVVVGFRAHRLADILLGALVSLGALVGGLLGVGVFGMGGAWGRPLRIRGRQLHPSLKEGADWTSGPQPDPGELDLATRRALEALWLHDAQKEHASVPAFSRVSWLLAAAGAPAELLVRCHRAATEEIEHTQACFALAAGYGARSFTVEPMPELLLGGLDGKADPRVTLAVESLADGCQLEDFNADVAAACAVGCIEPVTRAVLVKIAREERTHAELSWAILGWTIDQHRELVEASLCDAVVALDRYQRPTSVSHDKQALVARASRALLRAHGRIDDAEWQAAWEMRLVQTKARLAALLAMRVAA